MGNKLLIVEDDANLLFSLQAKFRVEGFDVQIDNGSDFDDLMAKMKTFKPAYLILDLILPQYDGFKILNQIKSDQATAQIIIFVFTNLSDSDSKTRSQNLGADYYLIKSEVNLDDLVSKVKKIINHQN